MLKKGEHLLTEEETKRYNAYIDFMVAVNKLLEIEQDTKTRAHLMNLEMFGQKQLIAEKDNLELINSKRKNSSSPPPPKSPPHRIGFI